MAEDRSYGYPAKSPGSRCPRGRHLRNRGLRWQQAPELSIEILIKYRHMGESIGLKPREVHPLGRVPVRDPIDPGNRRLRRVGSGQRVALQPAELRVGASEPAAGAPLHALLCATERVIGYFHFLRD